MDLIYPAIHKMQAVVPKNGTRMGFVNFNSHADVAMDTAENVRNRAWALRSCCYSIASLSGGLVGTDQVVASLAQGVGAKTAIWNAKIVIVTDIGCATERLAQARLRLKLMLKHYENDRRRLKASGDRFPVAQPFTADVVLLSIEKSARNR